MAKKRSFKLTAKFRGKEVELRWTEGKLEGDWPLIERIGNAVRITEEAEEIVGDSPANSASANLLRHPYSLVYLIDNGSEAYGYVVDPKSVSVEFNFKPEKLPPGAIS